ncbi:hypothetical protein P7K49_038201, partial [Saguinus oedipus]
MGDQRPRDWLNSPGWDSTPRYRDTSTFKRLGKLKLPPINTDNWLFMKWGMDDYSYDSPSPRDSLVCGRDEYSLPKISGRGAYADPQSRPKKPLKEAALFSKLSPARLARRVSLEEVEDRLMAECFLARRRSRREDTPPDLLPQVLKPQDPERKLKGTWACCEDWEKATKEPAEPGKYPWAFYPWPPETRVPHLYPEPPKTCQISHLCPEPPETGVSHLHPEPPDTHGVCSLLQRLLKLTDIEENLEDTSACWEGWEKTNEEPTESAEYP